MKIQIHAPWEVNPYFTGLIQKKVAKLYTFYERIERADVYLKNREGEAINDKSVEIRLAIPGNDLFAEDRSDTVEKAFGGAIEKVRRQLVRQKEKWTEHRKVA